MSNEGFDSAKEGYDSANKAAGENFDKAKDAASDAFEDVKEGASEAFEDAKEAATDAANDFKKEYKEFTQNGENKRMLAGLLGIFLGWSGAHKFVLGYKNEGFIMLGIFLVSIPLFCVIIGAFTIYIPVIVGLIEGIIYLTKSEEEFYQTYQVNKKPWF